MLTLIRVCALLVFTLLANGAEAGASPEKALQALLEGNERFVMAKYTNINITNERREELVKGQQPFAVIVSCSDSRVPPELVFDQGLGELFVIRTAGQVIDDVALGSIEYAIEHLNVPLIFVLGHDDCGAVKAAIAGGEVSGHISAIVNPIKPAIDKAKTQAGSLVANTVKGNLDLTVEKIKTSSPIISQSLEKNHVKVVGAIYNLESGKVNLHL